VGFRVGAKASAWLCTAALLLGTSSVSLTTAVAAEKPAPKDSANDVPLFVPVTPPAPYFIERVGNQGIKLSSKSSTNSYAITVLGSNGEANSAPGLEAWQKSLGVEVEGKLGSFMKTDLSTRFTELEGAADPRAFGPQTTDALGMDRRALEEFSLTTKFLGDRVAITSSRRASDHLAALDSALEGRQGAVSEQDKFNAWVWRSPTSSLSLEGSSNRVDSGFQNLSQAMQTRNEENQQLKSKFSYGRAGIFVGQHEALALAPDRSTPLSRQSDIETGASLGLSDLRTGGVVRELLPDSIWVSTSRGAVEQGSETAVSRPLEKSAVGMTRSFDGGSLNLSYWRSQVTPPVSDESQWRSHGMDIGGTLKSGPLSLSGNLSVYSADTIVIARTSAESNVNGSLFLTWSRAAWPKLSAGVTNYAYQSSFFDYGGVEQSSLMRYEVALDSTPLLSGWRDPQAQLKFIASYQDNSYRSQWAQTGDTGGVAQNVFFGFKFSRSLLP